MALYPFLFTFQLSERYTRFRRDTKRHIASRLYAFPVFVPERLPLSTHRSEESYPAERSCLVGGAGACSILRTSPFQSFVQIRSFCLRVYAPSAQMVLSLPDSSSEVYFVVHKDDSRSAASFVFPAPVYAVSICLNAFHFVYSV